MTKEEVTKHLLTHFSAEMEDASKYYEMAESAEKMGKEDLKCGLVEMVLDEYSHARFIKSVICDMEIDIPEDHMKKWEDLEKKIEPMFQ